MKKIFAIFIAAIMICSVMLTVACDKTAQTDDSDVIPVSSEEESTSSTRKRISAQNNPNTGDEPDTGDTPTPSYEPTPPTSNTPNPSYDTSYSYTTSAKPDSDTGDADVDLYDSLVSMFVSDYPSPELNANYVGALESLEQQYNALNATQKALSQNSAVMFEARTAYDLMAVQQAELIINELPAVDANNLDAFYLKVNEINALYKGVKDTSYMSSAAYQTFQEKVNSAGQATKTAFEQLINDAKATFEYTPAYKTKLDGIKATYDNFTASQKSSVATAYNELNALYTKYNDTGVVNEFKEVYNKLPVPSAVVKDDKTNIELANTMFNNMTPTQLQLLGDTTTVSAKLKQLKDAILVLCPEYIWARTLESNKNLKTKAFTSTFKIDLSASSATGSNSTNFEIDGKQLKDSFNFNKNSVIKLTGVPYAGKLVIYLTNYDSSTPNVVVASAGYTETKAVATGQPLEFNLPAGGDYTITLTDRAKVYGVVFS